MRETGGVGSGYGREQQFWRSKTSQIAGSPSSAAGDISGDSSCGISVGVRLPRGPHLEQADGMFVPEGDGACPLPILPVRCAGRHSAAVSRLSRMWARNDQPDRDEALCMRGVRLRARWSELIIVSPDGSWLGRTTVRSMPRALIVLALLTLPRGLARGGSLRGRRGRARRSLRGACI